MTANAGAEPRQGETLQRPKLFDRLSGFVSSSRARELLPYLLCFTAVLFIALLTYFPATQIAIESNDQLDGFFPTNSMAPPVWQTILDPFATTRALDGLSMNMLAFSEFDFTRVVFSIFPKYWEISVYYLAGLLALYSSFILAMHLAGLAMTRAGLKAPNAWAIATGGLLMALLPHNAQMFGSLVSLNLFVAGSILSFKREGNPVPIACCFLLSAFFGDIYMGTYVFVGTFLVIALLAAPFLRNWRPAQFAVLALVFALAADYRTVLGLLVNEPTQRSTWLVGASTSLVGVTNPAVWQAALNEGLAQIFGKPIHYHYQWNTNQILFILVGLGCVGAMLKAIARPNFYKEQSGLKTWFMLTGVLLACCIVVCLGYGILSSNMIPLGAILGLPVQFERIVIVLPLLAAACVTFATSAAFQAAGNDLIRTTFTCLVAVGIAAYTHIPLQRKLENIKHFVGAGANNPYVVNYTVGTVYQRGAFNALKEKLGADWQKERVVSVQIDPMVAVYNGFRNLDGYYSQYPKRYQQAFRKVIAPALDQLPSEAALIDGWGSRFGPRMVRAEGEKAYAPIDGCALSDLGGTLVLSAHELVTPADSKLVSLGSIKALTDGLTSSLFLYRPSCAASKR